MVMDANCTEIPQDANEDNFFMPPPWLSFIVVTIGIVFTLILVLVLYGCRVTVWKIVRNTILCSCMSLAILRYKSTLRDYNYRYVSIWSNLVFGIHSIIIYTCIYIYVQKLCVLNLV